MRSKSERPSHANEGPARNFFLVHSLEGFVAGLEELVGELEAAVYGIQCRSEAAEAESVEALTRYYLKRVLQIQGKGEGIFNIGGHSRGCSIVLEMARILEAEGEEVNVFFLEGSQVKF
jgi:thioesterase domain-containing protein